MVEMEIPATLVQLVLTALTVVLGFVELQGAEAPPGTLESTDPPDHLVKTAVSALVGPRAPRGLLGRGGRSDPTEFGGFPETTGFRGPSARRGPPDCRGSRGDRGPREGTARTEPWGSRGTWA